MEGTDNNQFANQQDDFAFGRSNKGEADKKKKTADELAEERLKQTYNVGGGSKDNDDLKRKREDFAVQLRKNKREEMFKQKRAFTTEGQANTPNTQTETQSQQMVVGPQNQLSDDMLLQISVEDALMMIDRMSLEEFISQAQKMAFHIQDFQKLLQLIQDTLDAKVIFATVGFRRLLSQERNPPIQPVIDANLVPKFISFLQRADFPKLQFEAAWCLTNIASGQQEQVQVLIDKGTVNVLVELLNSPHLEVVEQAIWGLGNIAGDGAKIRDMVIAAGAINPISNILDRAQPGSSFVRNASWTLSNLCRGKPAPNFHAVKRAVPSLAKVLIENDVEDILIDVCWAISYLSDGGEERIPIILETNVVPRLIQLLQHPNIAISVPCLRTIGNIVTGDDDQTQFVINAGALEQLNSIIYHKKKTVRKEVCWSLSNITAGNPQQIQLCLDLGIIDKLINILINDDIEIKKEAVWAVSNSTAGATFEQFIVLVHKGILKALSATLKMRDARILAVALEGIDNILKSGQQHFPQRGQENQFTIELEMCGGLEEIEQLQTHPNHSIYERAMKLLVNYFEEQQDAGSGMVGIQSTAQNQFSF
ncbi:importin subunit alpha-1-like [Stylonychia lemnae]|uniref:Importin subunit alpha n=1 Tax=Stylonychia lemnae TaxID=5949 RepID=A0A077ZUW4_STYLE|nr:importin subunit alpha-1-like [Stylonychia lemnae]|eukprot:CDW72241.1 importin subunit alpha-1-like [Stylonychia lemnae]